MQQNVKLHKLASRIEKGQDKGSVVFTEWQQLRAIGIPVDDNGKVNMRGTMIGFEGTFDGFYYFTINNLDGTKLQIPVKAVQEVTVPLDYLGIGKAIVPVRSLDSFYGLLTIRVVSNAIEPEERTIDLYFGA